MARKRAASRSPDQNTKPTNKHARAGKNVAQQQVLSASSLRAARASSGQRTPSTRATRGAAMVQQANPDYVPPAKPHNTPKPAPTTTSVHTPSAHRAPPAAVLHTPNKPIPTASACLTSNAKALLQVPLPEPFTALIQIFGALQTYHDLCRRRGQKCYWHAAQVAIEESTKRRTTTKHILQLQALCPDACTISWTRTPPSAQSTRLQWALGVVLHDQGGAPHAAQGITSPRSPTARLSRCQTQQLQQAQLKTKLAMLVLQELQTRIGPPPTTTSTTKHDTAARITDALAAGASAADVIDTIRNDADAHQVDADITRLTTLLQTHNNTWPWCPVLPEATLPPQPASPSRSSHLSHLPMTPLGTPLSGTPLGTPATAAGGGGQPLLSTGRSRLATQIKEYARVRRLSFGGGGGGGKDVRGQGVVGGGGVQGTGKGHHGNENHVVEKQDAHAENNTINVDNDNNDDDSVLASLPAALRRRSMDGTLPIALSTIKAMRVLQAEHSVTNSPAALAQKTQQATHALLPRVFDCIRLLYANEPRAKPVHMVVNAITRIDGVDGSGVGALQLLQALAAALPEWLNLAPARRHFSTTGLGGGAAQQGGEEMVVVKAQGVDHGALRGKLVHMAGPRRRLSLGAVARPVLLPNVY